MKNIFTKKTNTNIIKRVAGAFKKLPAFVVYFFYDDKSFIINDTTTALRPSKTVIPSLPKAVILSLPKPVILSPSKAVILSPSKDELDKACHPELVEGTGLPNFLLKIFFKKGIFNKRHTFKKMRVVHLNIQNNNTLSFNKHAMKNSTLIKHTRKFRR